ncbi:MAG: EcsC family protein, partial [Burkholderiales bacterium]
MDISEQHYAELREAKRLLEHPSYMARLADVVGTPIEKAIENLPDRWRDKTADATKAALNTALKVAVKTMDASENEAYPKLHRVAAAITGAAGGAFGLAALPIELPISTTVMLRSIADIARANGESLESTETQLACLMVFSLGGKSSSVVASESGYFSTRAVLAKAVSEAAA